MNVLLRDMMEEEKLDQAYQVIGFLLYHCGMFETEEAKRALDYFSDSGSFDEDFLPWPRNITT